MRVALTAAYNRLEDLNPEWFWSSMIQRNPLPPTLLSIFRQKYLHIPSDPSCARFWMALRHCHPAPFSEKDDSLNAIACESDDCSTSEVIAALDYLAEAESQDTTVREIQHRLLNHSTQFRSAFQPSCRRQWCPLVPNEISCLQIYIARRDSRTFIPDIRETREDEWPDTDLYEPFV